MLTFSTIVSPHSQKNPSECQTVWTQIRTDILSALIWVQTGLQKLSADEKLSARMKRVNLLSALNSVGPDLGTNWSAKVISR